MDPRAFILSAHHPDKNPGQGRGFAGYLSGPPPAPLPSCRYASPTTYPRPLLTSLPKKPRPADATPGLSPRPYVAALPSAQYFSSARPPTSCGRCGAESAPPLTCLLCAGVAPLSRARHWRFPVNRVRLAGVREPRKRLGGPSWQFGNSVMAGEGEAEGASVATVPGSGVDGNGQSPAVREGVGARGKEKDVAAKGRRPAGTAKEDGENVFGWRRSWT